MEMRGTMSELVFWLVRKMQPSNGIRDALVPIAKVRESDVLFSSVFSKSIM